MAAKAPKTSVNGKLVKTQPVPKTGAYATRKLSRGELPPIYKCAMCGNVYAVATGIFYKSPNSVFAKNQIDNRKGCKQEEFFNHVSVEALPTDVG